MPQRRCCPTFRLDSIRGHPTCRDPHVFRGNFCQVVRAGSRQGRATPLGPGVMFSLGCVVSDVEANGLGIFQEGAEESHNEPRAA